MKPFLLAVDGPDGAGKSTLAGGLKARYEALGHKCWVIHVIKHSEPGALYYADYCGGVLEGDPVREACGMLYSVMDSIHTAIAQAEEQGIPVVIFDRSLFSILAYQLYTNGYFGLSQCSSSVLLRLTFLRFTLTCSISILRLQCSALQRAATWM